MKQAIRKEENHIWTTKSVLAQVILVLGFFCIFYDTAFLRLHSILENVSLIIPFLVATNGIELILIILFLVKLSQGLIAKTKELLKEKYEIFIFDIIFVISSISIVNNWLNGDGYDYYCSLSSMCVNAFGNPLQLNICGHQNNFTVMWYLIGEYLLPNFAVGVRCMTIVISVITITLFYGILRHVFSKENRITILILTAIFAYNPLIWGIMAEFNTDFFILCAFVWVIYFCLKKRYILMAYSALLLCYSKENGVVVYAGIMLGWLISILIRRIKKRNQSIKKYVCPFLINCIPGVLWLAEFKLTGGTHWGFGTDSEVPAGIDPNAYNVSEINSFDIWPVYIFQQIKELLFVNFGWVYVCLAVIFVICLIVFHKKKKLETSDRIVGYPIICGMVFFLGFQFVYVTWTNYRYLSLWAVMEGLIAALFILYVVQKKVLQQILACGLLVLVLFSNFNSDPLSEKFMRTDEMGNGYMSNTSSLSWPGGSYVFIDDTAYLPGYGDLGVTNREYNYRGICFNEVLKDISYDENTLLIIPTQPSCSLNDGQLFTFNDPRMCIFGRHGAFYPETMYVNRDTLHLAINAAYVDFESETESFMPLNAIYTNQDDVSQLDILDGYDRVFCVYYPFDDEEGELTILDNCNILDQFEVVRNHTKCIVYQIK